MKFYRIVIVFVFIFMGICLSQEDLGKKYYESAMAYLETGNYNQAEEDFEAIIKSLPDSAYADDALLELGKYYLEKENNKEQAEKYFTLLKEKYVKTENGPAGYYYLGRANLILGATIEDFENAYSNFERILVLFPKSKWVQQALHDAAIVKHYLGNDLMAISLLNQAVEKFPKTPYTDLSKLELGLCYLNLDKANLGLYYIQQVINNPYNEELREIAKNYLAFVLRIGFRSKTPTFNPYEKNSSFSLLANIKEPKQIIYRSDLKTFYVFDDDSNNIFIIDRSGKLKELKATEKLQSFFLDNKGDIYLVSKKNIINPANKALQFSFTYELKTKFINNMKEAAVDSAGNYYIVDNTYKGIFKFDNGGNEVKFPLHRVNERYKKILIDRRDRLILSLENKAILIYKNNAELLKRIDKFEGVSFKEIIDMGFDDFGNFYILDTDLKAVFIYNPMFKEIGKYYFSEGIKPINFAIGEEGDLYIINKKNKMIEHYR
mgnify:CR=1 FL=1